MGWSSVPWKDTVGIMISTGRKADCGQGDQPASGTRKIGNVDLADPDRSMQTLFDFESLMIAMRKDVGYPESTVKGGELLRLFVDDAIADTLPK
ncbi:MAG: hypothetical protein WKF78_10855 [Candidatus Limnocylindrales bacterium]